MGDESSMRRPIARHDALDDHAHVRLVLEADIGFDHAAGALDVDVVEAVDHDVADGRVLEQRLQRTQAEDLIEDLLDQLLALGQGHGQRFVDDELLHHRADLPAHAVLVQVLELIRRQRVQELLVDLALDLEPAVGARAGTGRLGRSATHDVPLIMPSSPASGPSFFRRWPCRRRRGRRGPGRPPARDWPRTGGALLMDASTAGEAGMP